MQRHILDNPKSFDGSLHLRQFLRIAKTARPHRASLTLQRRAQERPAFAQFLRIARDQQG
jgi:hypothetical protein